jgi:phage shock protein A
MSLFERFWLVVRANVNDWLHQQSDPEQQVDRALAQMQGQLVMNRQAVATAIAMQKRIERQIHQAQTMASEWYQRAQLAVGKEDDALARDALSRHKAYLASAQSKQNQVTEHQALIGQMKQTLQTLETKLIESRNQRDLLIARARSAQATIQVNDVLDRTGSNDTRRAFEQLEERVQQLEAQAEVSTELSQNSLDQQFTQLAQSTELELALSHLKAQLNRG